MRARRTMASAAAATVLLTGAWLVAAPGAAAASCPTVDGDTGAVTPTAGPGVDWSGCSLANADLSNADLSRANLHNADLSGANVSSANLAGANLSSADLFNAGLYDVNLTGASLTGANVGNASLTGSIVTCSDTGVLGTDISGIPAALADGWTLTDGVLRVPVLACPATPVVPDWNQAYARTDSGAVCLPGWHPSWAQWPGGGTGGFVCERAVPAFG